MQFTSLDNLEANTIFEASATTAEHQGVEIDRPDHTGHVRILNGLLEVVEFRREESHELR